jgi:hypothetical protein
VNEYVYQATCPYATRALWKNLTWDSAVPTGSSVVFSVKVGSSVADVATRSYTQVGTAKKDTVDTTTCNAFGPSPTCPVALTNQLGLGNNQGQVLSLQVETSAAGGTPTMADWKITYTCQYSQ